jgi:hypothetical protein
VLRERSIEYAKSENAYIILPIDADEILDEELTRPIIYELLEQNVCWDLIVAHFWGNKNDVRVDGIFAHQKNVRMFKVLWNESNKFYNKNLHCGSVPIYAYARRKLSPYYFRHYGYVRKEDIKKKEERQKEYDSKMLLENPDLYQRMLKEDEAKIMPFNKLNFVEIWKK